MNYYSKYLNNFTWWGQLLIVIAILGLLFGFFCLDAWILKILWNAVVPSIFSLVTITFKQAFELMLLVWVLRSFPVKINWSNDSKRVN